MPPNPLQPPSRPGMSIVKVTKMTKTLTRQNAQSMRTQRSAGAAISLIEFTLPIQRNRQGSTASISVSLPLKVRKANSMERN
eukprot:6409869-Amphidinium_carterae.1